MRHVAAHAAREAERIYLMIHRMGDMFVAPIPEETAVTIGCNAIAWWSGHGITDGEAGHAPARTLRAR